MNLLPVISVQSYSGVNGIPFGSPETDVVAVLGEPRSRHENREGESELHYAGFIVRFSAHSNRLRELTLLAGCTAALNGVPVLWDRGWLQWLASEDPNLQLAYGYVISEKLGIAVTGVHDNDPSQQAVHAFAMGDMDDFMNEGRLFCP